MKCLNPNKVHVSSTLLILILFFSMSVAFGQSFPAMTISKNGKSVLLVGSSHVGINPVTKNKLVDQEIAKSNGICFEYDDEDKVSASQSKELVLGSQNSKPLNQRFSETTLKRISEKFSPFGITEKEIFSFQPMTLYLLIERTAKKITQMNTKLSSKNSVDAYIKNIAKINSIPKKGLEEKYAVAQSVAAVSDSDWEEFINRFMSLVECEECVNNYVENMLIAYEHSVDPNHVNKYLMKSFSSDPWLGAFYSRLLINERNTKMVEKLEIDVLSSGKCDVVAIGAAHLGGENGLLVLLQRAGFRIKPI